MTSASEPVGFSSGAGLSSAWIGETIIRRKQNETAVFTRNSASNKFNSAQLILKMGFLSSEISCP
jgi:hypothetical protein